MSPTMERLFTLYYGIPLGATFGVWLVGRSNPAVDLRDEYTICWALIGVGMLFGIIEAYLNRHQGGVAE